MSEYRVQLAQGLENNPGGKTVRRRVFMEEQGFCNEFDKTDEYAWHVVVYDGEDPIATGRIFPDPLQKDCWHFGRIAVLPEYRGKSLGALVMNTLEEKARQLGAKRGLLSAQVQAQGFYFSLGYRPFGSVYNDEHCPHINMEKQLKSRARTI